ncbi:nuclease-related domain-containing protein [Reinekea sp.]
MQAAADRQEKSVAFYLRREFKMHKKVFVFHDLNIFVDGEFAQIDHLIVYQFGFILIESKSITGEVKVNREGEWSRSYQGKWSGIPSPVKQVELQMKLLKALMAANAEKILGKLFGTLQTRFGGRKWDVLCAISSNAIIDRERSPESIGKQIIKSEFISDKVLEIMNLPSKLKAKAGFLMDDRANFSDEELKQICNFLVSVDKQVETFKKSEARSKIKLKSAPISKRANVAPAVDSTPAAGTNGLTFSCKKCGEQHNLTGKWGKFGYYAQCNSCETNTSLKIPCPNCQSDNVKNRKEKNKFYLICLACNEERLVHENAVD